MNHGHRPGREERKRGQAPQPTLRIVDPNRNYVKELLDDMAGASRLGERELSPIKKALQSGRPVGEVAGGLLKPVHLHRLERLQMVEA